MGEPECIDEAVSQLRGIGEALTGIGGEERLVQRGAGEQPRDSVGIQCRKPFEPHFLAQIVRKVPEGD